MRRAFDDFLIDRICQPAVDAAYAKLGWSRHTIARQICRGTSLFLVITAILLSRPDPGHEIALDVVIWAFVPIFGGTIFRLPREIARCQSVDDVMGRDAQPLARLSMAPARQTWFWVQIVLSTGATWVAYSCGLPTPPVILAPVAFLIARAVMSCRVGPGRPARHGTERRTAFGPVQ